MPLYSYSARDQEGNIVRGTVDAVNLQAARSALEEMNLKSEEIHEATPSERTAPDKTHEYDIPPLPIEHGTPPELKLKEDKEEPETQHIYFPIIDTLRLYAGWLLAGYFVAYMLGAYQITRPLPFQISYVLAFLYSPLILSFALAAFLFLLATGIQRRIHGGVLGGFVITLAAIGLFILYRVNT